MIEYGLRALQYSSDLRGPFALYIYYPDEEITIADAKLRATAAISAGNEVRICDGGDQLVFHSVAGEQLYPKPSVDFWASLEGAR